jgi:hypothetical protein
MGQPSFADCINAMRREIGSNRGLANLLRSSGAAGAACCAADILNSFQNVFGAFRLE